MPHVERSPFQIFEFRHVFLIHSKSDENHVAPFQPANAMAIWWPLWHPRRGGQRHNVASMCRWRPAVFPLNWGDYLASVQWDDQGTHIYYMQAVGRWEVSFFPSVFQKSFGYIWEDSGIKPLTGELFGRGVASTSLVLVFFKHIHFTIPYDA